MIELQEDKEVNKVDIYKQRVDEVETDGSKRGLTQNTDATRTTNKGMYMSVFSRLAKKILQHSANSTRE